MSTKPQDFVNEAMLLRQGKRMLRALGHASVLFPEPIINRGTQIALDALLSCLSLWLAYLLRFDGDIPPAHRAVMWSLMLLVPILRPLFMLALGAYDAIWRYFNLRDSAVLVMSALPVSILLVVLRFAPGRPLFQGNAVPASVIIVEYVFYLALAGALRALRRVSYELSRPSALASCRALLIGTEATLPHALRHASSARGIEIIGVLAEEDKLQGMRIGGHLVMEKPAALPQLLVSQRIDLVIIADARPEWIADVVATATDFGADVRLLPSATHVIRGEVRVSAKAAPEQALARSGAELASALHSSPHPQLEENFRDRVVLITGAGGSIGSELARQVSLLPVSGLVLLDRDENSIFELIHHLAGSAVRGERQMRIASVVGDIRDSAHLRSVFEKFRPHIVLHAAAYKHVPIMESNVCEAVLNNISGTSAVARTAIQFGAERFVMISTDKAVKPSSVMGATKRIAEMLSSEMALSHAGAERAEGDFTRIACVRFGNVVGSRGSVVPIFLQQISEGGPITITDEHMTRYFMTIPEAAHLVLQAASLASDGDIYMLDMGDPVKITTLARKLIELSGLRPEKDIQIRFTGARPGEKIVEELWHAGAAVAPTIFPRVMAVKPEPLPEGFLEALQSLEAAALRRNEAAVLEALRRMPIEFSQQRESLAPETSKSRSAFVN